MSGPVTQGIEGRFKRVERKTVTDQVRAQLVESIRLGRFAPGQRVPPERQLCDELGVARTTLREAIQQLVSLGMLERRSNRLHVVEHFGVVEAVEEGKEKQLRDLMEARRVIEISLTELAACRATDQQRVELVELSAAFDAQMNVEEFRDLNHRFHMAVGECCGNALLFELYGRVLQAVFESSAFASLLHGGLQADEVKEIVDQVGKGHRQIAQAVHDGNVIFAAEAAADHVAEVENQVFEKLI